MIESIILPSSGSWRNKGAVTIYQGKVYFLVCAKFYIAEPNSFKALKRKVGFFKYCISLLYLSYAKVAQNSKYNTHRSEYSQSENVQA